jgi:hypothetical protein
VLKEGMSRQNRVVWLNNGSRDLRGRIDAKIELGLLSVVSRETLKEKRSEARACTTTNSVENKEALKAITLVSNLANAIQSAVEEILANSIMAASIVVRSVLLAADELVGMEELGVSASANFVDNRGLQVDHDGTGNVFARTSLAEKGLKALIVTRARHSAVRLNTVLEAIEFPAGISCLDASLANVEGDDLTHIQDLKFR